MHRRKINELGYSTTMSTSPDSHAAGLTARTMQAGRYDGHTDDPFEAAGTLRSLMPSNVRVVDVGCGTGSVTLIANRGKNNEVTGIETDAERSDVARARGLNVVSGYRDEDFLSRD